MSGLLRASLLTTSLLTTIVILLSLILTACGKDEKDKPKAKSNTLSQVSQQAKTSEHPITEQATTTPEATIPEATTAIPVPEATQEASPATTPKPAIPITSQTTVKNKHILGLARKSGCLACHSVDKKLVGPAWKDVAARYKNNSDARKQLIVKVSKGGKGNWTDVTGGAPMPPYFPRASREDIEQLVDFVLSL